MYRRLHLSKILETLHQLQVRISERFPQSRLSRVCAEVYDLAECSKSRIDWITRPHVPIRIAVSAMILLAVVLLWLTFEALNLQWKLPQSNEVIQLTDSLLSIFFLVGGSLFFLVTLENRLKRDRALSALHELRAIAHVVDMHQLTKDPVLITTTREDTPSSPKREMTPYQLQRYLDYCAEMLSLVGKVAALYSQKMPDPAIVSAANDIEALCASLSQKIWQKMRIHLHHDH